MKTLRVAGKLIDVMLDPSLFIAEWKARSTVSQIVKSSAERKYGFYLPQAFLEFVDQRDVSYTENAFARFFSRGAYPVSPSALRDLTSELIQYVTGFEVSPADKERDRDFFESLSMQLTTRQREDTFLLSSLFQEWVFLQTRSWVVSRIKRPFNRFINAGTACLHLGREAVDALLRRTIHKEDDYVLSNLNRLRAFGKWLAVGGNSVTVFFGPVLAAFGGAIAGSFLLLDPSDPFPKGETDASSISQGDREF